MKKTLLILTLILSSTLIHNSLKAQSGWVQLNPGTSINFTSIYFLDFNTGYVVGWDGVILKTTNAGLNWVIQTSGTTMVLSTVQFVNYNTGYIAGYSRFLKTTNSGVNWSVQNFSTLLEAMFFTDANTGFVAGRTFNNSIIAKTTDGGNSWSTQTFYNSGFFSIYFPNALTGYTAGPFNTIKKTTNTGVNWPSLITGYYSDYSCIYFIDANTGYVVAEDTGKVFKTINGGLNWNRLTIPTTSDLMSVRFHDASTGYATGYDGVIIKTTSGGMNWNTQNSGTTVRLSEVFLLNANTGYIAGYNGVILKTTNGGASNIVKIGNEVPQKFKLYQNYPNPFNGITRIGFDISESSNIDFVIYSVDGKEIEKIFSQFIESGEYYVNWEPSNISSGIYYYHVNVKNGINELFSATKKLVIVK